MSTLTAPKEKRSEESGLRPSVVQPSSVQRTWLSRGLTQPGGKLPLFDTNGQRVSPRTIQACIDQGWAEPWFANPTKPDWLVCKLTEQGRIAAQKRS